MKVPRKDPSFVKNQSFFRKQKGQSHNFTRQNTSHMSHSRNYKSTNRNFSNVTDYYVRKGSRVSKENGMKEGVCPPPFAPKSRFMNSLQMLYFAKLIDMLTKHLLVLLVLLIP